MSVGTAGGTFPQEVVPGSFSPRANRLTNLNGTPFFTAETPGVGNELWKLAPNRPPVAAADAYTADEDRPLNVIHDPALGLLANDADPDGDALTAAEWVPPDFGEHRVDPGGTFVYRPFPDFYGTDEFTYEVSDGSGGIASAKVTVTVRPVNDAPTLTPLPDLTVPPNAGERSVSLQGISTGAANEAEELTITAVSSNPAAIPHPTVTFDYQGDSGTLSFTPAPGAAPGTYTVTVTGRDDGGTANGGINHVVRSFHVTIEAPPLLPLAVTRMAIGDGSAGAPTAATGAHSIVRELFVAFDRAVTLGAGAFVLTGRGGAAAAGGVQVTPTLAADGRSAVLRFGGAGVVAGSLPDGVYDLAVRAAGVHPVAGPAMAADATFAFHRLFSDGDGDGDSDAADLSRFRQSLDKRRGQPGYLWYMDYDDSGVVDAADLQQTRGRRSAYLGGY